MKPPLEQCKEGPSWPSSEAVVTPIIFVNASVYLPDKQLPANVYRPWIRPKPGSKFNHLLQLREDLSLLPFFTCL